MQQFYKLPLLLIFLVHFVAFWAIKDHGMMMDEHYHYRQIVRFMSGDFKVDPELPMTPGYHYTLASIGKVLGFEKLDFYQAVSYFRFVSWAFSLVNILIFYLIARKIDLGSAYIKTLEFSFFPLTFIFFPILYTDLFSLLFILVSFYMVLQKRYFMAALISSISIFIRQNNIFWILFLFSYIYVKNYGFVIKRNLIREHIRKSYFFFLGLIFLGIYLIYNGRLSAGEQTFVNFTLIHPSNIYLILFAYVVLFLPVILPIIGEKFRSLSNLRKSWYILLILLLTLPLFLFSFTNTHPYNQGTFFIHNWVAVFFTQDVSHKLLLLGIIVLSVVSLTWVKLKEKVFYLIYPWSVIFLLPLWFIEQRYYIIPFTFFLLFRKNLDIKKEFILLIYFILISFTIYFGIFYWKFFL